MYSTLAQYRSLPPCWSNRLLLFRSHDLNQVIYINAVIYNRISAVDKCFQVAFF